MIRQFGALRGIAIFLVILNHSITLSFEYINRNSIAEPNTLIYLILIALQTLGLLAVPTFYFISGGFQVFALRGKSIRLAYRTIANALPHIIIPYLVWSILFYLLLFLTRSEVYSPTEYLKFLLVGYPLNFVPLLVGFYLLSPILIRLLSRWPSITLILIGIYQALTIIILRPGILRIDVPSWALYLTIPGIRLSIAIWGLFFPLGMAFGLYKDRVHPWVKKTAPILISLSLFAYVGTVLHEAYGMRIPYIGQLLPFFVVLTFPIIEREKVPLVRLLEQLGRRSYGLYLSNLIFLTIGILLTAALGPVLFTQLLILVPLLIFFTISSLWLLMSASEKLPTPIVRRYVFG
jgi:peptidoglycan/LPS O-acetylase OafA/YrhL